MRRALPAGLSAVVGLAAANGVPATLDPGAAGHVRHSLKVALDPTRGWLTVEDDLTLPPDPSSPGRAEHPPKAEFLLHAGLRITSSRPAVAEATLGDASRLAGTDGSTTDVPLKRYRVALAGPDRTVHLRYEGEFDFGLSDPKEEYSRGFRETAGIVSKEGVYLAGDGFWYPHVRPGLVEYAMEVAEPAGWHVISAGNGTSRDATGRARWESHGPVDEITLVGGPLHVYRDAAGAVESLVYLRQKDDALASKYLQATAQYLEMYRGLLGPYPYGKFALVENFWETGYGMPSYTLLGPEVIRFPFILTSSYPHEILHNWWGNGVFVDYAAGNWSEGLTAYMADHLLQEQRGRGEEYRRDTLQKYRSYVRDGRDFPLTGFRSRQSASTEAVGYGKALMVFHMVRERLGDEAFRGWAARFYREYRGKQASFADIRRSLETASGQDLRRFFADHVERDGAARLQVSLSDLRESSDGGFEVAFVIEQVQPGAPLELDVPVVIQTLGRPTTKTVRLEGGLAAFTVKTDAEPVALHVDPSFDVFRLLDPRETPPSIGQIFGEPRILAVLPTKATDAEREAWRRLIEGWKTDTHVPEVRTDAEVVELPKDRAAWLLGRENALAARLFASGGDYTLDAHKLRVDREEMPLAGHSAVIVRRHPKNLEQAVGWIFADGEAALPGLGRKLPHYGKYSYLGFEGDEPTNVLKGQWTPTDSPLRVDLRPNDERGAAVAPLLLPARKALAELPPVFSQKALLDHVEWLSAPEREGRGIGTKGLEDAAEYVAAAFKAAGLQPGGDEGTYFQAFSSPGSPSGAACSLRNVIGVLPGTKAEWKGQSALLTAHYDHLGLGWPDVHKGDEGKLHPGADDNASGVAVMLELAKVLASAERPRRTIAFVAFAGEEAGLLGSRHYVDHPPFPLEQTIGVINLDTVGRLLDKKLSVVATGTASEWPHIFRGAGYVTGVEARLIPESLESSDQKSFIDRGVPAVQIFTEPHADYHRPGDTADKVDGPGLVKVATFVKEGIAYLGDREGPLTSTIGASRGAAASPPAPPPGGAPAAPGGAPAAGRRVSFGTMPDFAFAGPGVRVAAVTPGSPAEKAGVSGGDIVLKVDGRDVANLQAFAGILRGLAPGQTVTVILSRSGREQSVEVTVVER
ncbi:MAG TPA: M20/M25/M40 family metallo-hydrolase [Vicinamibacteria bacterium]|nr:M20/M25/M40 family metallo-hydrolase [Vicinamibacteria bacterium]